MLLSVDRIENGVLICENSEGSVYRIPLEKSIKNIKEGSIIELKANNEIILREDEYKLKKEKILFLRSKLNRDI